MDEPALSEHVAAVADGALGRLPQGELRSRVEAARAGLRRPLRVAVAGREKAGKSTLVNALLRQRIAPTDAGVCTKVVTWYVYGEPEGAEVTTTAGVTTGVPLRRDDEGAAVVALTADPREVERLTIRIPNPDLLSLSIIDTPGLASVQELDRGARDLLFMHESSRAAGESADGLIFLLSPTVMADDRDALTEFAERFGGLRASAGNAIGVLSRADQAGDGSDPWPTAERLAARLAEGLATTVSAVTPVVGLLAESMPYLDEHDADHLESLAALADRDIMLLDGGVFLTWDCDVPTEARRRLLRMLGRFGLTCALEAVDTGVRGAVALADHLEARSGIARVRDLVAATFAGRADALRASSALSALSQVAYAPDLDAAETRPLRNDLERLLLTPAMHRLAEMQAAELVARRSIVLPEDLRADVHGLLTGSSVADRLGQPSTTPRADLVVVVEEREKRWRAYANDPRTPGDGKRIADVFSRSHALLWDTLATAGAR